MAFDAQFNEAVLVLELGNKQVSYARCLNAIDDFENKYLNAQGNVLEFFGQLKRMPSDVFTATVNQYRRGPNDKMESPLSPDEYARIPLDPEDEEEFLAFAVDNWRKEKEKLSRPHYHIRIVFEYDTDKHCYNNLDNLQFLAMFMQRVHKICFGRENDPGLGTFAPNELQDRLSVFLVPHYKGDKVQFGGKIVEPDVTLYSLASQYLRLATKMHTGVVYGLPPPDKTGITKATAVKFAQYSYKNIFFPLLYLAKDSDNYQKIFEKAGMLDVVFLKISERPNTEAIKQDAFIDFNYPEPFGNTAYKNPHTAIADMILDETRARLLEFFASMSCIFKDFINPSHEQILALGREEIAKHIDEEQETKPGDEPKTHFGKIVKYAHDCDRFTFALFGYLLAPVNGNAGADVSGNIERTMRLARELGDGVRQIVQNSLQHSEYSDCYISFVKTKGIDPSGDSEDQLRVRIADFNLKKTITKTFTEMLGAEGNSGHFSKNNVDISIGQLVGDFDYDTGKDKEGETEKEREEKAQIRSDKVLAWYDYRRKDVSAHIGLTIFYNVLKRCNCRELEIISNISRRLADKNNSFRTNFWEENEKFYKDKPLFPPPDSSVQGTQISFVIPIASGISSSPVNLVQLGNNEAFREDYDAFAHYLDYKASLYIWKNVLKLHKPRLGKSQINKFTLTDATAKINAQNMWASLWLEFMNSTINLVDKKRIHFCNIDDVPDLADYLKEKDNCEVFIKGFFAAASRFREEQHPEENAPSCFYYENMPTDFVKVFQDVSIPLSVMDFSENLQVFFSCKGRDKAGHPICLLALGNCVGHVMQNSYILSLEHGERGVDSFYYINVSEMLWPYKNKLVKPHKQFVCPFTVFKQPFSSNALPRYFQQIEEIAGRSLVEEDENNRGYKLPVHMRIGNKVHADSFFELSFLFYQTAVANRTAFYVLRKMLRDETSREKLLAPKENIVFYGYASYSQALVVSLREILQKYIKKEVYYAIYQYNLQTESSKDKIKVYSTFPKNEVPAKMKPETTVVQIVPIGSTLTTFDKMRARYTRDREKHEQSNILANYNVFLVRDDNKIVANGCTLIESGLWEEVEGKKRIIKVKTEKLEALEKMPYISYIIEKKSVWSLPKDCNKCFPIKVRDEEPLVETDLTSTVPTLQLYQKKKKQPLKQPQSASACSKIDIINDRRNRNIRLYSLFGCVYHGHFLRGKNHFQYYIDTQKYINKPEIKRQIEKWLTKEREKEVAWFSNDTRKYATPVLNIIFSPEHNTNVGFSQYVNAYFFNGTAEIVALNVDKQYRSNFICEHNALQQTIERLFQDYRTDGTPAKNSSDTPPENPALKLPVRFFFVDDTIISGGSYRRANALLLSIIPEKYRSEYGTSVFSKCFVLIDRLSSDSQRTYVTDPYTDFSSFCKINISNMRTQGDSCVGCKLEGEAKNLFKRSTTRSFVNYWAKKKYSYRAYMFDELKENNEPDKVRAFVRMMLTHIVENSLEKVKSDSLESGKQIIKLFDVIVGYKLDKLLESEQSDGEPIALMRKVLEALKKEYGEYVCVKAYLFEQLIKILTRPFLIYNLEERKFILRFVIDLCESILNDKIQGDTDSYKETIEKIIEILKAADIKKELLLLDFIKNCLFESLADMKSTYLLRKGTMKKVYNLIKKYKSITNPCKHYNKESCECFEFVPKKDGYQKDDKASYPCGGDRLRCFWKKYAFNIHKITVGSGDETRSLWMEYLFTHGEEYFIADKENPMRGITLPLYESIIMEEAESEEDQRQLFKEFCTEIFLQNTRLLFDGIEDRADEKTPNTKVMESGSEFESGTDSANNSYFLENMDTMRHWDFNWAAIEKKPESEVVKITGAEKEMFNFVKSNGEFRSNGEKNTKLKYKNFLKVIIKMVKNKYNLNENDLRIALVTQRGDDETDGLNFEFITAIIKISDNENGNEILTRRARAKSFIKRRIIWALKADTYGKSRLRDDGYLLVPHDKDNVKPYFDFKNDTYSYRKPFFILRFDNILANSDLGLDRDAQPIDDVYLYFSFGFEAGQESKEKVVPLLIIRDILSYRNRIMRMLEKDFSSHLMGVNARTTGENAILKHEKTVSHSSTSDDQLPERLWKTEDFSEGTESQKSLEDWGEYEWLLFRNYTNIQIAKLFNRNFLRVDEEPEEEQEEGQTQKLYLQDTDFSDENIIKYKRARFNLPAKKFEDLFDANDDRRIKLCDEIINFSVDHKSLDNAKLVSPKDNKVNGYFNQEYLKCLLFDNFLTGTRIWAKDAPFVDRIQKLKNDRNIYKKYSCRRLDTQGWPDPDSNDRRAYRVFLLRDGTNLIIINPLGDSIVSTGEGKTKKDRDNEDIIMQLQNPIDSFSGHMSLFTCYRYLSGNYTGDVNKAPERFFSYRLFDEMDPKWQAFISKEWTVPASGGGQAHVNGLLWFISSLPIFEEESVV